MQVTFSDLCNFLLQITLKKFYCYIIQIINDIVIILLKKMHQDEMNEIFTPTPIVNNYNRPVKQFLLISGFFSLFLCFHYKQPTTVHRSMLC